MIPFAVMLLVLTGILALAVIITAKAIREEKERNEKLAKALESARNEIRRIGEYEKKKEEAQKHADEKKEMLHTGDDAVNFSNSIDVLHNSGGRAR
jgi:predicted Holliday junction resolvase-like endonuclease